MWQEILAIAGLLLFSGTKFMMAPGAILAAGYSIPVTLLIASIGGVAGSLFFFYLGSFLFSWWERYFPPKHPKKKFTRKNRLIIKLKNKFGVVGLALMIPLISIPISALLSAKYFRNDRKAVPAYFASVIIWSVILTYFSQPIVLFIKSLL